MKKFDLNIEKILENWDIHHGIREIISNAIDEQILSKCQQDLQIYLDSHGKWHLRDYGRGLKYEHFTQNENEEKLSTQSVIGKFGIGLKDALATFERHGISVEIKSRYNEIKLGKTNKFDFDDLLTLHAYIYPPTDQYFIGTEFVLSGVSDQDIQKAKELFLKFTNARVIEKTKNGEIIQKSDGSGKIFINGVKVAEEDNFLFSYNITNLSTQIRKALNRERTNVGRTAYSPSIKSILLSCESKEVADILVRDLKEFSSGNTHDELKWIDVQEHSLKLLNSFEKVVFVTIDQTAQGTDIIEEARQVGFEIITIPTNLQTKIQGQRDNTGKSIMDLNQFHQDRNENFQFHFVTYENLSFFEKSVFDTHISLLQVLGRPWRLRDIKVSETMQKDDYTFRPCEGLWDGRDIIIKRSVLNDKGRFIAVFLHELAHCTSGGSDATRTFESELTKFLGILGERAISE